MVKLEHVPCDQCGADDYIVRYRKPDDWLWLNRFEYPVVECQHCGLVYVNPRPTFEAMAAFYPAGYHDGRDDAGHLRRYERQFTYLGDRPAVRMLDVGCARGDWLHYVGERWPATELHGVDAFSDGVRWDRIRFQRGALARLSLPDSHFDLITAWAVLEHVHDPGACFAAIARALRPGGRFVFLVTNADSAYGRFARKEDVPRHLFHFNRRSLQGYARKCGLVVERIDHDGGFWDGSGRGTFRHAFGRLCGVTWRDIHLGRLGWFRTLACKAGTLLDLLVFLGDWEVVLRCSGIIVVTMSRPA